MVGIACCISRRIASAVAVMLGRSRISEVARSCCSVLSFRASYPARPATPLKGVRRLARGSEVQKGSMQQTQQERKHNPAHTHTQLSPGKSTQQTQQERTHTHTPSTQTRHIASDTTSTHTHSSTERSLTSSRPRMHFIASFHLRHNSRMVLPPPPRVWPFTMSATFCQGRTVRCGQLLVGACDMVGCVGVVGVMPVGRDRVRVVRRNAPAPPMQCL